MTPWNIYRTEEKRRQTLVKMNAPKPEQPVLDYYDCKKETPYEIEEVLQDKVWNVSYKAENMISRNKKMSKMFFGDPEKPEYQQKLLSAAKVYGDDAVETAKKVNLFVSNRIYSRYWKVRTAPFVANSFGE